MYYLQTPRIFTELLLAQQLKGVHIFGAVFRSSRLAYYGLVLGLGDSLLPYTAVF